MSTFGQVAAGASDKRDMLRVPLAQPLNVESDQVAFTSKQVVDRVMGVGVRTQHDLALVRLHGGGLRGRTDGLSSNRPVGDHRCFRPP